MFKSLGYEIFKSLGQELLKNCLEILKLLGQKCLEDQTRKFKIVRLGSFEIVKLEIFKLLLGTFKIENFTKSRKRGTRNRRSTHVTKIVTKTVIYEKRSVK